MGRDYSRPGPFLRTKRGGTGLPVPPQNIALPSVQNFHQPAAADGDGLTGLDVLGAVADIAVDIGVIGG